MTSTGADRHLDAAIDASAAGGATASRHSGIAGRVPWWLRWGAGRYLDLWGVVATITLITSITNPPRGSGVESQVLAGVLLLALPWVRQRWWAWGLLTAVTAWGVFTYVLVDLDNHHFLHVYWLTALTVACLAKDPSWTLARAGRLMVGWLFLFATLWKLLTPDFADGSFFAYLFSVDRNLTRVPIALDWVDPDTTSENRIAVTAMRHDPQVEPHPVAVQVAPTMDRLSAPLAWLTIVLEGAVAATFLLPLRGAWTRWREASLFAFVLVTYPALPVLSFAALLIAMSLSATTMRRPRAEISHVMVILAVWGMSEGLRAFVG